jgi:hypothetical protein
MFKFLWGLGFVHRMVNACRYDVCRSSAGLGHENICWGKHSSHWWLRGDLLGHIRTRALCLDLRENRTTTGVVMGNYSQVPS